MNYRPDIDGLRAIAVLFVLFFHSGLSLFPSGFVGVDVFFVISGYLITSIIYNSMSTNTFSFIAFYNRRLWRLQPVFICLIAVSVLMTVLFYLPEDLIFFGRSARKTSVFLSNLFFGKVTSGYFSPDSNQMPLLHTWSLSVEWQCYLLLPAVILVLNKLCGPQRIAGCIYFLTLLFCILAFYSSVHDPINTYYQLTSRIFEFFIGACVAFGKLRWALNKQLINILSTFALGALFYIAMQPDVSSGFPNGYALILCGATALLIASGQCEPKPFWSQILSARPVVFIGLISYSLYIWHWPIFVLIRYLSIRETFGVLFFAWCSAFIVAYLSWRFIEKPASMMNKIHFAYSVVVLLIVPIGVVHVSYYFMKKEEGFPQRFAEISRLYTTLKEHSSPQRPNCIQGKNVEINQNCVLGATKTGTRTGFLIGDSYSNHHWRFIDTLARDAHVSILAHATIACLTLPGIYQYDMFIKKGVYQACYDQTLRYYSMIRNNHYDYVIIGENWFGYLQDKIITRLGDERSHALTKERIKNALMHALQMIVDSGAKPVLIKSIVTTQKNPHECFLKHIKQHTIYRSEECEFELSPEDTKWLDGLFVQLKQKYPQLIVIDPQKVLCPDNLCKADINGLPVFKDSGHITDYASYQMATVYLQRFENPLN
ncbi:acyltransferase family protein [Legionella worsleiensis]|uniref:Acyltransferase n=1 Tax=Legionella worsleiensis TaxID=45076 RepID=A0A0W1A6S7_9GAMM|nr:acyltransferase family protein [Legionella worsleiensis]KTD76723.1 acyltransferase [Legionella worsleiensis]STY30509.1 acyltransferase [Legionella worsleiensis]